MNASQKIKKVTMLINQFYCLLSTPKHKNIHLKTIIFNKIDFIDFIKLHVKFCRFSQTFRLHKKKYISVQVYFLYTYAYKCFTIGLVRANSFSGPLFKIYEYNQ